MQRITLIYVGKPNTKTYAPIIADYEKRLFPLCKFCSIEIGEEIINEKNFSPSLVQPALEKEGQKILAAVPKGAALVALCVEGRQLTSEKLAAFLENSAISGQGDLAFVIGSSHGLAQSVKQKAVLKLSLSAMTLPHQLARLVLTEQIYRGFMIRSNSKYHK